VRALFLSKGDHMTEDQIERRVERFIDKIDHAFLIGELSQSEYDELTRRISRWADVELRHSRIRIVH
jgi:hypothetical protein